MGGGKGDPGDGKTAPLAPGMKRPGPPEGQLGADDATGAGPGRVATRREPGAEEALSRPMATSAVSQSAPTAAPKGKTSGPFGADGLLHGRYRLVRPLGEGGMGAVYLVEDLLLRKHTALKTLIASWVDTQEELERFWREAGIVHRDLKPANVMLVPDERKAVVMDFGIAGTVDDHREVPVQDAGSADMSPWDVTSAGRGTPAYMAPEQWDERRGDHRTDLYALGVIMYVSLTGKAPFGARTMEELAEKHRSATPPDVSNLAKGVDKDLASLITRCLAKSPQERPADMDEVLAVLTAKRRRRGYLGALAAVIVAASVCAVAAYAAVLSVAKHAVIQEVRPSIMRLARLVSHDVDIADLANLKTEADMERPEFKRVLATLQRFKAEDSQITYVYIMRRTDKAHVYTTVVDADPEEEDENGDGIIQPDEEGAPPGTVYDEFYPLMKKTMDSGVPQADPDFSMDYYGISISGYAPMPGDVDKEYFVGVDMGNSLLVEVRGRLRWILGVLAGLAALGYGVMWWPLRRGGTPVDRLMRRRQKEPAEPAR